MSTAHEPVREANFDSIVGPTHNYAGLRLLSSAATLIERVQEEACVQPSPKRFRRSDGEGVY